jgi:uncharacterized membrane protein YkoI
MRHEHITPSPARPGPIARIGLTAAVAALGLAACGTSATAEERSAPGSQTRSPDLSEAVGENATARSKAKVGPVQAIKIATATVKGARVFDMELDREHGTLLWKLDVASSDKAYDVTINARSGKVVRLMRDRTPDRGMRLLKDAKVSAAKAARTATSAVERADLRGLELDRWRGEVVWEAELLTANGTEYDVKINARSAEVVSKRIDD